MIKHFEPVPIDKNFYRHTGVTRPGYLVTDMGYDMLCMPGSNELPRMWIVSLIASNEKGRSPESTPLERILQEFPDHDVTLKDLERLVREGYLEKVG